MLRLNLSTLSGYYEPSSLGLAVRIIMQHWHRSHVLTLSVHVRADRI